MDALSALAMFALTVGLLVGLGTAAALFGVDSRPTIGDDHNR
jgi:hypothetical protein